MRVWDPDKSGTLDLGEFITMYALAREFRFPVRGEDGETDASVRSYLATVGQQMIGVKEAARAVLRHQHASSRAIQGAMRSGSARSEVQLMRRAREQDASETLTSMMEGAVQRKRMAQALEEIEQLRVMFDAADVTKDGFLNIEELGKVITAMYALP